MADWDNVWKGIGQLGKTKSSTGDRYARMGGAFAPAYDAVSKWRDRRHETDLITDRADAQTAALKQQLADKLESDGSPEAMALLSEVLAANNKAQLDLLQKEAEQTLAHKSTPEYRDMEEAISAAQAAGQMRVQAGAQEYATGAREDEQAYRTEERESAQKYGTGEREATQIFGTGEREAAQGFKTSEREATQGFKTGEREAGQEFQSSELRAGEAHDIKAIWERAYADLYSFKEKYPYEKALREMDRDLEKDLITYRVNAQKEAASAEMVDPFKVLTEATAVSGSPFGEFVDPNTNDWIPAFWEGDEAKGRAQTMYDLFESHAAIYQNNLDPTQYAQMLSGYRDYLNVMTPGWESYDPSTAPLATTTREPGSSQFSKWGLTTEQQEAKPRLMPALLTKGGVASSVESFKTNASMFLSGVAAFFGTPEPEEVSIDKAISAILEAADSLNLPQNDRQELYKLRTEINRKGVIPNVGVVQQQLKDALDQFRLDSSYMNGAGAEF